MSNFDYYHTLSVSPDASAKEIKQAYRKLALETHPDRNPGDERAEERFKKINEAYGVLSDAGKRAQYDQYRRVGYRPGRPQGSGFGYSQDEIFRDFFTSRHAQDIFQEMEKEFARMGMRFDPTFINNLFFGGRNIFFQGFVFGPGRIRVVRYGQPFGRQQRAGRPAADAAQEALKPGRLLQSGLSLLGRAGKKGRRILPGEGFRRPARTPAGGKAYREGPQAGPDVRSSHYTRTGAAWRYCANKPAPSRKRQIDFGAYTARSKDWDTAAAQRHGEPSPR